METNKSYNFLVLDDHPIIQLAIKHIIEKNYSSNIIFCSTIQEAKVALDNFEPDCCIMDIDLPDGKSFNLCKQIRENSKAKTIVLTMHDDMDFIQLSFEYGANAFLSKANVTDELKNCIDSILLGNAEEIYGTLKNSVNSNVNNINKLTLREKNVLALVSQKMLSKEIGDKLNITSKSVDNYRARICKKLGLEFRNSTLLLWATENKALIDIMFSSKE